MQTQEEASNPLERNIELSVSREKVEAEVGQRLKRLAPKIKIQGFRPGKVPMKIVAQQYGHQIEHEVLGELLQQQFSESINRENYRIAGVPNFESRNPGTDNSNYEFRATFEIYPNIELGDLNSITINKPVLQIGDVEIQKTLEVLRKQRTNYESVDRPAQTGDRVNINYRGSLDGKNFAGGQADNYSVILGNGHLLEDFEASILGMSTGQEKTFDMTFPEDYSGKEVAGKKVTFTITLNKVEAPKLPDVDGEFAKSLGIEDGNVEKMQSEIKANLQRETTQRIRVKLKEQVMQSLLDKISVDIPKILVQQEIDRLIEEVQDTRTARGFPKASNLQRDTFLERAERRVRLGLILSRLIETHGLGVKPEQIKSFIEEHAQSYENPEQVVKWHFASPERIKEIEPLVLEDNAVSWILDRANIVDQNVTFDELMGYSHATNT
ncbi:trigger factor [Nitrosomonas eutropha]|uniref:trigger factor n=1 Tax=Nitrosomonas TaxID=914 RepID=UPI0008872455|nr:MULTISPECIES: trigger factor [Nitrosomonas]MXS80055.1 trigger factor [Nitrosomonas sp. GH22]SCX19191.1 trigger factor [Nitrosomonas eutropha]SDW12562.1 trigger factor [Nitrosomonas eutropha]